jgi:CRM1 C terminal
VRCRAFRHTERNIADTGLNLLVEICQSFEGSDFATQFYQAYHLQLLQEVFAVMTGEQTYGLLQAEAYVI